MLKKNVYAIYKGDKFLDLGTPRELAKKFNWKPDTVTYFASRSHKNRINIDNALIAIKIGTTKDILD